MIKVISRRGLCQDRKLLYFSTAESQDQSYPETFISVTPLSPFLESGFTLLGMSQISYAIALCFLIGLRGNAEPQVAQSPLCIMQWPKICHCQSDFKSGRAMWGYYLQARAMSYPSRPAAWMWTLMFKTGEN